MIKIPEIEGFDFTKAPSYQNFMDSLVFDNWEEVYLGLSSDHQEIYGFTLGDVENKPVLYIQGGIHGGHEWRCAHWIKRFMEILEDPSQYQLPSMINKLKSKFAFFIIPFLNSYGYDNSTYVNANGVNLNRNFPPGWDEWEEPPTRSKGEYPFSEPETQIIRDVIEQYKPTLFVDCHTMGDNQNGAFEIDANTFFHRHLFDASRSIHLSIDKRVYGRKRDEITPHSSTWASSLTPKTGGKTMSVTFEPGSLETHYDQSRMGMTGLLMLCIYAYEYHEKRVQCVY